MRTPHLDASPLIQMSDEPHRYPLLCAASIAVGGVVLFAVAWH